METFLWVEQYRPKTVDDCILPQTLKDTFKEFVDQGNVPNITLSGKPGVGKTTIAKAMVEDIGATWMMINGSEESNIDVLRTKMKNFASTVSLEGGRKYLIIDEADYLNATSTQPAMRGFIEEFHNNCGFILTCNYKNRIIPALLSRCPTYDFKIQAKEKPTLATNFMKRVEDILQEQNVEYDKKVLVEVIQRHFPDWRRILNEFQRYSSSGRIDAGILVDMAEINIKELMKFMKEKEFTHVRKWVVNNLDMDAVRLYRSIYDSLYTFLDHSSIPHAVIILAEYQYRGAFAADQEINTLACLTEIMAKAKFK